MDWTSFPPLTSLRAFEAAARNRSFSAAGRELNVSHAAIAQQVRQLEARLGVRLVERAGRGIALTAEGELLTEHLTRGFGQIAEVLQLLDATEQKRPIQVTMTPSFAVSWFLPRMQLFRSAHPEIELMVNPTPQLIDLAATGCDVAIRFGSGGWSGLESEPLVPSNFVIVAAPDLIAEKKWTGRVEDLVELPWLQELGTSEVEQWLADLGIALPVSTKITNLPGYMVLGAVRDGQGAAATARVFVEDDLASGRLVKIHEATEGAPTGYHLVWRPGVQRPALKAFLRWIRRAAKDDAH